MVIWCVTIFYLFIFTNGKDLDYEEIVDSLKVDLGKLLEDKSKDLPKTDDIRVINNKCRKDMEYEQQLKQQEAKEESDYQKAKSSNTLCNGQSYPRDYSYPCPEDWQLLDSGECWGVLYKGPCESLNYLTDYTIDDKRDFEIKCCVSWPRVHTIAQSHGLTNRGIRGPVNHLGYVLSVERV